MVARSSTNRVKSSSFMEHWEMFSEMVCQLVGQSSDRLLLWSPLIKLKARSKRIKLFPGNLNGTQNKVQEYGYKNAKIVITQRAKFIILGTESITARKRVPTVAQQVMNLTSIHDMMMQLLSLALLTELRI